MNEWERQQLIKDLRATRQEDLADLKVAVEDMLDLRLAPFLDHEARIRILEKARSVAIGALFIISGLGGIIGVLRLIGVIHPS